MVGFVFGRNQDAFLCHLKTFVSFKDSSSHIRVLCISQIGDHILQATGKSLIPHILYTGPCRRSH